MKHILCLLGRHKWTGIDDAQGKPIVRLWTCQRKTCGKVEELR